MSRDKGKRDQDDTPQAPETPPEAPAADQAGEGSPQVGRRPGQAFDDD